MSLYFLYSAMFLAGGNIYCAIELLFRKRTHISMFLCAGTAITILLNVYLNNKSISPLIFSLIAVVVITSLELIYGAIFNLWLKEDVWDYSKLPLNLYGQICLYFSGIWFGFGIIVYLLFRVLRV